MSNYRTILVIDDNDIQRKMISGILNKKYNTIEAENGAVGLNMAIKHANELSLILLDLTMPIMNGCQFLEKAANNFLFNNIPIIVLTSDDQVSYLYKALELGANDILPKPFDSQKLLDKVSRIIHSYQILKVTQDKNYFNLTAKQLAYANEIDRLTGLFSKEAFLKISADILQTPGFLKSEDLNS